MNGNDTTSVRLSDFMGIIPAITGKVELVYEGEQEGAAVVAQHLISDAIKSFFPAFFPKIEKLERDADASPYAKILEWFFAETGFELLDDATDEVYKKQLDTIQPLEDLIQKYQPNFPTQDNYFLKELVLWGLVEFNKLSKERFNEGYQFKDLYSSFITKL
jgi:magnesium chelatase subunit I